MVRVDRLSSSVFVLLAALLVVSLSVAIPARAAKTSDRADGLSPEMVHGLQLFSPIEASSRQAVDYFAERSGKDAVPVLILALRFVSETQPAIIDLLRKLTGETTLRSWDEWMVWQEANPIAEYRPFDGFDHISMAVHASVDPALSVFVYPGVRHEIRLEEITWGGVVKDGIPPLTNPKRIAGADADFMSDDELVFGIAINGDARAYPFRMMDWHEMFNDVVGGVPVSLAYCTLCGSGILFETTVEGREKPFVFGSSGFLFRSNKLMYDEATHSLWNQFTGRPVVGPLTGSGIELKTRPVVIGRWADWKRDHPATTVLSLETGYRRDYSPGAAYGTYFASDKLMFPASVEDARLKPKDYVFALRSSGAEKAWPLRLFERRPVLNDVAGIVSLTLVGDAATRTVRAYRTDGREFSAAGAAQRGGPTILSDPEGIHWRVTEEALVAPDGKSFHRLPGHVAYWFAWSGYLGKSGELASE